MHAVSAFQESFSLGLPCRAPAYVYGYIGLCRGYVGVCIGLCRAMSGYVWLYMAMYRVMYGYVWL